MNIIVLSTTDTGGAGLFAYRLHSSFCRRKINSYLIVKDKNVKDHKTIQASKPFFISLIYDIIEYFLELCLPQYKTNSKYSFFTRFESFSKYPAKYIINCMPYKPDIILVGWVSGFVNFKTIYKLQKKTGAKIVFYFTDMGMMTGGCHYDMFCNGYVSDCKNCPAILNQLSKNRAYRNLNIRKKYINLLDFYVFPGTKTLETQTNQSYLYRNKKLFECTNIPINKEIFNDKLRTEARKILSVPLDKRVILIGASSLNDERKGIIHLIDALDFLQKNYSNLVDEITLLIIGSNIPREFDRLLQCYNFKNLNIVQDEILLSITYQAADIFVCPSIYDSGPMMVVESLMCGTPVVSFSVGISNEFVINKKTGYRAENFSSKDLAIGIYNILCLTRDEYKQMRINCINYTSKYCAEDVVINKVVKNLEESCLPIYTSKK